MLVVFTVRRFKESDIDQVVEVYQSAFAEPPWDEYMKCASCGVNYGMREKQEKCKNCGKPLILEEFWAREEIIKDLEFALAQQDSVVLVAGINTELLGMTWGYRVSLGKFPFLANKISEGTAYMDEIAVKGNRRLKGIGTLLGRKFIDSVRQQDLSSIVLRTDERNQASMALFRKLGFSDIPDLENPRKRVYDPEFPDRIYLRRYV